MKNVLYVILGIFLILLTSASTAVVTANVIKVEPATPKSTIVFYEYNPEFISNRTKPYLKQGYVLKAVYGDKYQIVVLEKY